LSALGKHGYRLFAVGTAKLPSVKKKRYSKNPFSKKAPISGGNGSHTVLNTCVY